jgi:twitching motility protein PilT
MIDHINASQARHIVTIEDPIEVLHADRIAIISQREVGADTTDVADAIHRASRQDADVIFASDLPDAASVREALAAAASGRLVLAVMNTLSATDTVAALVDRFEPHQQMPIRQTLGRVLRGVICQRLVDRADARGRVAVVESLVGTQKVRDAIQQAADPAVLERLMTEGDYHGMATFDQALFQLFSDEYVSLDEALERAAHPEDFRIAVQQAGLATLR